MSDRLMNSSLNVTYSKHKKHRAGDSGLGRINRHNTVCTIGYGLSSDGRRGNVHLSRDALSGKQLPHYRSCTWRGGVQIRRVDVWSVDVWSVGRSECG